MNLSMKVESYAALYHLARSGYGIDEAHANQIKHWYNQVCQDLTEQQCADIERQNREKGHACQCACC